MPTALVYARISTKGQEDGASLESQIEACREYAERQGYTVAREVSEIFSGSYLFDRPLLNECREEIRAGRYDALIVYDIDRLSRNVPHLGILLDECQRFNTELLFVKTDFEHSPEGMLLFSIRGYLAEAERLKIIERTTRGRRAKAKSGTLSFKRKLFGYELDEKGRRVIRESEAEAVRFIFASFLSGDSLRTVAAKLSNRGIQKPTGGCSWWATSVRDIITNPAYAGRTVVFRQKKQTKFVKGERVVGTKRTPETDHTELPTGTTPPIVSESDFSRAQQMLVANRQTKRRKPTREFLLRGFVRCAVCGRALSPHVFKSWRAYVCTSKQNPTVSCGTKSMNARVAEALVWDAVVETLKRPRAIERLFSLNRTEVEKKESREAEMKRLDARIAKIENEIGNLVARAESVDDSLWEVFRSRIETKQKELGEWKKKRDAAASASSDFQALEIDIQSNRKKLGEVVGRLEELEFEEKALLLKMLDISISWDGEKIKMEGEITAIW